MLKPVLIARINLAFIELPTECEIFVSSRSRSFRLSISPSDGIRLVVPKRLRGREALIRRILNQRGEWLKKHWRRLKNDPKKRLVDLDNIIIDSQRVTLLQAREIARERLGQRVALIAAEFGFSFNRISIRNQKSCWGSCSPKRNLSFNWRLILLPPKLTDYVIHHELMHLRHPNHSKKFWQELKNVWPECHNHRRELRKVGI